MFPSAGTVAARSSNPISFTGVSLTGSSFTGSSLTGVSLTGVSFTGAACAVDCGRSRTLGGTFASATVPAPASVLRGPVSCRFATTGVGLPNVTTSLGRTAGSAASRVK